MSRTRGLELCFSQGLLSFATCCPHPLVRERPPPGVQVQVVQGPWEDQPGCDASFPWAAEALTPALLHGPAYHPHTGELMEDVLPAQWDRWAHAPGRPRRSRGAEAAQSGQEPEDREARYERVKQMLSDRWATMGFRSFMAYAEEYYKTGL